MSGSGWILHDGEGMPVDGETVVQVRLRGVMGAVGLGGFPAKEYGASEDNTSSASLSWWEHQDEWHDIMAYKVVEK